MYLGDGDGPPHEWHHVEQKDARDVEEGVAEGNLQQRYPVSLPQFHRPFRLLLVTLLVLLDKSPVTFPHRHIFLQFTLEEHKHFHKSD